MEHRGFLRLFTGCLRVVDSPSCSVLIDHRKELDGMGYRKVGERAHDKGITRMGLLSAGLLLVCR